MSGVSDKMTMGDRVGAAVVMAPAIVECVRAPRMIYGVECLDAYGRLKWREDFSNLVTDEGLNELLQQFFKGSAYTAAWYVGLKGTGSAAAGDTAASHAGWSEVTGYSQANRPTLTLGSVAAKSVNNTGSPAAFSINATVTVAGCFVINNNTKGGTTGKLYSAGDFAASRGCASSDTVNATVTLTGA